VCGAFLSPGRNLVVRGKREPPSRPRTPAVQLADGVASAATAAKGMRLPAALRCIAIGLYGRARFRRADLIRGS